MGFRYTFLFWLAAIRCARASWWSCPRQLDSCWLVVSGMQWISRCTGEYASDARIPLNSGEGTEAGWLAGRRYVVAARKLKRAGEPRKEKRTTAMPEGGRGAWAKFETAADRSTPVDRLPRAPGSPRPRSPGADRWTSCRICRAFNSSVSSCPLTTSRMTTTIWAPAPSCSRAHNASEHLKTCSARRMLPSPTRQWQLASRPRPLLYGKKRKTGRAHRLSGAVTHWAERMGRVAKAAQAHRLAMLSSTLRMRLCWRRIGSNRPGYGRCRLPWGRMTMCARHTGTATAAAS